MSQRRRASWTAATALAIGLSAPAALLGQSIEADRPGLLYAGSTLPRGRVQLELGVPQLAWTRDAETDSALLNFPSVLRVGLGAALELQLGHTLLDRLKLTSRADSRARTGLGDASLALKLAIAGAGARPGLVWVASLGLPTGEQPFSSDDPVYALQAQAGWVIGAASLGALVGYARGAADGPDSSSGALAVSLGVALGETWGSYVEAGSFPGFDGAADTATLGVGLTRILRERVQLDAFVNRGLNEATADWTAGAGLSVRF